MKYEEATVITHKKKSWLQLLKNVTHKPMKVFIQVRDVVHLDKISLSLLNCMRENRIF